MVDKLEPCPFCGGDFARVIEPHNGTTPYVMCVNCTGAGPQLKRADAIAAWNRRTPANGEQVERIADALKAAAEAFDDPVGLYVKGEYLRRFERDNPNASREEWDAAMEASEDESWRILARAAAATLSTPTEDARARVKGLEEAQSILASLKARMTIACDHTRAGKDHVKVRTADWHALMGLWERARTALGNKETDRHG